jgi:hypothetical protein
VPKRLLVCSICWESRQVQVSVAEIDEWNRREPRIGDHHVWYEICATCSLSNSTTTTEKPS